jgi:hypothetical protein
MNSERKLVLKLVFAAALAPLLFFCGASSGAEAPNEKGEIAAVVGEFLIGAPLAEPQRRAVLAAVAEYPNQTEWVMSGDGNVYSLALRPIQKDPRPNVRAKLEELASNSAALRAKYWLYLRAAPNAKKSAYRDEESFAGAVVTWDERSGEGRVKASFSAAKVSGDWAFAIIATPDDVFGELSRRVEAMDRKALDGAYCEILYPKARELFAEKRYGDALPFYMELRSLEWAKPAAYLEAAECFAKNGQKTDAAKLVAETLKELDGGMDSRSLEYAGDILLELGDDGGAEKAYRAAAEKMRGEQ